MNDNTPTKGERMTQDKLRKSIADHNRKCLEALKEQNAILISALEGVMDLVKGIPTRQAEEIVIERCRKALTQVKSNIQL